METKIREQHQRAVKEKIQSKIIGKLPFSLEDASMILEVTVRTIHRYLQEGSLSKEKIGRKTFVRAKSLERRLKCLKQLQKLKILKRK